MSNGFARLIPIMDKRIIQHMKQHINNTKVELGVIQPNGALKTDGFPIEIPDGEYLFTRTAQERCPESGDRVIVHWSGSTGVVTDVLGTGSILDYSDEDFDEDFEDEIKDVIEDDLDE